MVVIHYTHCAYLLLTYLLCSLQCVSFIKNICKTRQNNGFAKTIISLETYTQYRISQKNIGEFLDCIKCAMFVIIANIIFDNKNITALTSIVALAGNYFPFFCIKKNQSKNFLCIIIIGTFLDIITSGSMLFAYCISIHYNKHKSIAMASAMFVGIVKTIIHLAIISHPNYVVATYFIVYGLLGIKRNKKTFVHMYNYMVEKHKKEQEEEKIQTIISLQRKYKGRNRNRKYSEKVDIKAKKMTERKLKMKRIKKQDMLDIADKARNEYKNSNKAKRHINYDILSNNS